VFLSSSLIRNSLFTITYESHQPHNIFGYNGKFEGISVIILAKLVLKFIMLFFRSNENVILENRTLRHQLNIQQRNIKRPKIQYADRIIFVWISYIWKKWRSSIVVVKPDTIVGWHRKGFKLYWKRKSRRVGRPKIKVMNSKQQ